jgi:hypothetical protein
LKATREDSVRSNGLAVSVVEPPPCPCGPGQITRPPEEPTPDVAQIEGVPNGRVYSRRSAPRVLEGSVKVPAGDTLREVRIALERKAHGRCFAFSGSRGAFVRASCHATRFFDVADTTSFSYLLPARLPAGRYVYDIEAVDDSGHLTKLVGGVSHVVFYVK